jgi:hypothetical protein
MNLTNTVIESMENKLPKVIDARTHGVIDYMHAAFFLGVAWFCRKSNPRGALAAGITGAFILTESLMTDYPLGAFKKIPFEDHGRIDAGFAASSMMMPGLFGFEGTGLSRVFKANAFAEAAVVGMTDWNSEHARAEEKKPFALAS